MYADLLNHTAELFYIHPDDLSGPSRAQHINQARQAAAYALRRTTPLSLVEIGKLLGRKDHTTIQHAVRAAEQRARVDINYALNLAALCGGA